MAYEYESKETRVLRTIDSKRYPDTNKDFEKNIRRLNSSVDYMSSYMRVMQKGIDDANKNFIEQIQSFINDLIVLFAGGEPTGIEIGDLKYIIQAIGALFGFGDSPFPINLLDAAAHFFQGFLAPLVQLTDLIFDAINAWMQDFADKLDGVPVLGALADNLAGFFNNMTDGITNAIEGAADAFAHAQDIIDQFVTALGLPSFTDVMTAIGNVFQGIFDGIDFLIFNPIDAAIQFITNFLNPANLLANWGELFGNLTGGLVGGLQELGSMIRNGIFGLIHPGRLPLVGTGQIGDTSPNLLTNPGFDGSVSISGTDFVHDATDGHTTNGCAKTTATGATKSLVGNTIAVTENQAMTFGAWVKYTSVTATASANAIRLNVIAYDAAGGIVSSSMVASIASPSGNSSGPWIQLSGSYTVPANVANVVLQLQVTSAMSAGVVKFDDTTAKKTGLVPQTLVSGLQSALSSLGTGITNVVTDLSTLATNLLTNTATVVGNIAEVVIDAASNTLQHAWDWLTHLFNGGRRNGAATTAPPAAGTNTLSDVVNAAESVSTATYNTAFTTDTLQGWFNTPRSLPSWLGVMSDDVSFAQTLITGTTTPALGTLRLIPVRVAQDRQYDAIKFGLSGGITMTNFYVGLYDVDETTGNCTKVLDLGDVKAQLNATYNMQTITIPSPISVQAGELYYIGILQVGGTAAALHYWSTSLDFTTGQYPQFIGITYTTTGIGALPSTIAKTATATSSKIWGALGTAVAPVASANPLFFSYSAGKNDTTSSATLPDLPSPPWTTRYGHITVWREISTYNGGTQYYSSRPRITGSTYGVCSYVSRLAYQDHEATVLTRIPSGTEQNSTNSGWIIGVRGNGNGTGVYGRLRYDINSGGTRTCTAEIRTNTGTYSSLGTDMSGGTLRATATLAASSASVLGTLKLSAVGTLYTLSLDTTTLVTWTDTSYAAFPLAGNNTETFWGGYSNGSASSHRVLTSFTAKDTPP